MLNQLELYQYQELKNLLKPSEERVSILEDYNVTDKADGERNLIFISSSNKVYLINNRLSLKYTGLKSVSDLGGTLMDGEFITQDKFGNNINDIAVFDIYFYKNEDISTKIFYKKDKIKKIKIDNEDDEKTSQSTSPNPIITRHHILSDIFSKKTNFKLEDKSNNTRIYLKEFLFDPSALRAPVRSLSGGEKSRLILAKLMAKKSNLLLLDEPTNDLDIETLDLLQEILCDYDGTIILISHDRDFVEQVATRVLFFEGNGKIIDFTGGYRSYLNNRSVDKSRKNTDRKSVKSKTMMDSHAKKKNVNLSFTDHHRLREIPREVERLELEIKKLEDFLSIDDLYLSDQKKFDKASTALAERKLKLDEIMEEWLLLEDKKG